MVGGQNYFRKFAFMAGAGHNNQDILIETKSSKSFADFSRSIEVIRANEKMPSFQPYINEYGENGYKHWIH